MLTTFVIVGIHSTIYWGNLMSIEAILILQLSLSGNRSPRQVERWLPGWHVRRVILAHETAGISLHGHGPFLLPGIVAQPLSRGCP